MAVASTCTWPSLKVCCLFCLYQPTLSCRARDDKFKFFHCDGSVRGSKANLWLYMYVYLIDLSPLGLFRANEINHWNTSTLNELRIPTSRRQTSWRCTSAAQVWTRRYLEQIQVVVRVELELEISWFQVRCPNHLAMLPPPWLLPWLSLAYGPIDLLYGTYPPMKYRQVNDVFLPQWSPWSKSSSTQTT